MKIKKTIAIVTIALAANAMAQQNASAPVVQATEQPTTVNAAPATSTPAAQAEQAAQPATQATAPTAATDDKTNDRKVIDREILLSICFVYITILLHYNSHE